jgi:putative ABC transport system substrate-binding protein
LRELGLVNGQNIELQIRYAGGDVRRVPAIVNELLQLKPDVLVTGTTTGALTAKQVAPFIPVVSAVLTDPIGAGLVASYARPGGNITGILLTLDDLPGKLVELAVQLITPAVRIGMLVNVSNAVTSTVQRRDAEKAAETLGVTLMPVEIRSRNDLEGAFRTFALERAAVVLMLPDAMLLAERRQIAIFAAAARLPSVSGFREEVEAGGLISYGINLRNSYQRAASLVDKILKGAKPADLPVEFPTKLELVVNVATAKAIGLTIPPAILIRADEVIE